MAHFDWAALILYYYYYYLLLRTVWTASIYGGHYQKQVPIYNLFHNSKISAQNADEAETLRTRTNFPITVRNNGGEVFRLVITSDLIQNTIEINFEETDGSHIRQLLDFDNNIQLFRLARLGEQDLNEKNVQLYCFITRFLDDNLTMEANPGNESNIKDTIDTIKGFVSPQLMSRLSQKNPSAIRYADEDRGLKQYEMDLEVVDERIMDQLSPYLKKNCLSQDVASTSIYARSVDLHHWYDGQQTRPKHRPFPINAENASAVFRNTLNIKPNDGGGINTIVSDINLINQDPASSLSLSSENNTANNNNNRLRCGEFIRINWPNSAIKLNENNRETRLSLMKKLFSDDHRFSRQPCRCSIETLIPWYVCDVRYCHDPNDPSQMIHCGVKTCRRRYQFRFAVSNKMQCLADFDPSMDETNNGQDSDGSTKRESDSKSNEINHIQI